MSADTQPTRSTSLRSSPAALSQETAGKRRRSLPAAAAVAATVLSAYVAAYVMIPKDGFWINDNECKFLQVQGLIRTEFRDFSIPWPGKELDPELSCSPLVDPFGHVANGRLYCFYPPMFALVSTLPYRLWGSHGLHIGPFIAGLLTLPAIWYLAGLLPGRRSSRPIAVFLAALATPIWFYSMTFWEHTPSVCLTTWSVAFCMRYLLSGGLGSVMLSAALCGFSVYFRDDLYLLGAAIGLVMILFGPRRRWLAAALFALALGVSVLPLLYFQWKVLGNPLGHHFTHHSPLEFGIGTFLLDRFGVVRTLLIDCYGRGVVSFTVILPYLLLWLIYPRVSGQIFRWLVPLICAVALLGGLVISFGHLTAYSPMWCLLTANSLFAVSPILILGFICRRDDPAGNERHDDAGRIQRALWTILSFYVLAFVFLVPKMNSSGIHWGCRLVLPAYPLMAVMAGGTLATWWHACRRNRSVLGALLGATVALSVGMQAYSLWLLAARKEFAAEFNRIVAQRPETVIVTNHGLVPQYLSGCFYDKRIFLPVDQMGWLALRTSLRRARIREALFISGWRPGASRSAPRDGALNDSRLKYMSVMLKPLNLRRTESMRLGLR